MSILKRSVKYIFALAMLLVFTAFCSAASTTWVGGATGNPTDWNTASNWSTGNVPTSADAVTIGSTTNLPTLATGNGQCLSLAISGTTTLTIYPSYTLNVATTLIVGSSSNTTLTFNVPGSGTLSIGSDYTNYGTVFFGPGALFFSGNFTDATNNVANTTSFGTGLVTFNPNGATVLIRVVPNIVLAFTNITFINGKFNFKSNTGNGAGFAVNSTGVMTLSNNANLVFSNTYGITFYSDANGSATLAAIPKGCSITGSTSTDKPRFWVQRFIKGSTGSLTKRGYRLMSSSVYTGTDANANVYDFQYLLNSVWVSGLNYTGNGFNVTTTQNPTLYLFREDDPPPPSNSTLFYTSYNWKGVAKINTTTTLNTITYPVVWTQFKTTITNTADTATSIPVGNGFLFYFRGDQTVNLTPPYSTSVPDVKLTEYGGLNMGTVNVRLWFSNSGNNLGSNLSYTPAYTNTTTYQGSLTGGFALVGNPYPSTINWEKFNANSTVANSSIYGGGGLTGTIYVLNAATKQYESYIPLGGGVDTVSERPIGSVYTGTSATNMIASGQGFFVQASATSQTLSFRETAKTNTQPKVAYLQNLMGKPVATTTRPKPLLRIQLVKDSINNDEIVVRLGKNFSTKYIHGEDALDLGGSSAPESLSIFSSDSVKLAISSVPFPGIQKEVIRLAADATASGTYKLNRTQLDNLPKLYTVWLKDAFTGDSVNLRTTDTYSFQINKSNPTTFSANRFTIVVSQDPAYAYHLLSFTSARLGNSSNVETHWTTANEENYTNFTVERSTDGGKTFTVVGGLWGTGAGDYSLMDKNVAVGTILYRLKSEDINNTITYSNIVTVVITDKGNGKEKLNVYPNPATNVVNLDVLDKTKANTSYNIVVSNSTGFIVKQAVSIQYNWQANISDLMPGTYLVRVTNNKTNDLIGKSKFIKL